MSNELLVSINIIFDWREYPQDFKNKYIEYIENEFTKRENGFSIILNAACKEKDIKQISKKIKFVIEFNKNVRIFKK